MRTLSLAISKYHLLLIPPIILAFAIDYGINGFSSWFLFLLYFFNVSVLLSFALLLKKVYSLRKYAPLKIILRESNIDSRDPEFNVLEVALMMGAFLFLGLALGLYLSIKANFNFFIVGISSIVFAFLAFLPKIDLFNKYLGSVYIGLFVGILNFLAAFQLIGIEFENEYFIYVICSFILTFLPASLEDLQRINIDFKDDKKTLANSLKNNNFKLIIIFSMALLYLSQIVTIIATQNVWHFLPLFSATIAAMIGLKIYSKYGSELNSTVNLAIAYNFFHTLLLLINLFSK